MMRHLKAMVWLRVAKALTGRVSRSVVQGDYGVRGHATAGTARDAQARGRGAPARAAQQHRGLELMRLFNLLTVSIGVVTFSLGVLAGATMLLLGAWAGLAYGNVLP